MKIVHVTDSILEVTMGGIGTVSTELYKNKTDNEMFVLFNMYSDIYQDLVSQLPKDIIVIDDFDQLGRILDDLKADVYVFHAAVIFDFYNKTTKEDISKKNIWYINHNNIFIEKLFLSNFYDNRDLLSFLYAMNNLNVISVSKSEMESVKEFLGKDKTGVFIYNGLNYSDDYSYSAGEKNTYGFIGRLDERKGMIQLCQQFQKNNSKLILAGSRHEIMNKFKGYERISVIDMLSVAINGNKNIIPVGWVEGKRKKSFFDKISALIVPSIYESFGMIYVEAGDAMTSIIANKTPASLEILGEDYPFFFDITDNESLNNVLNKFENMPEQEKADIAIKTKQSMVERFSAKNIADSYRNLFEQQSF